MRISVFAIVMATLRDLLRFVRQRPATVLVAMAVTAPLEYWLTVIALAAEDNESLSLFAASLALSVMVLVVWLPLWLVAIRQIISGTHHRFHLGSTATAATWRYTIYNILVLVVIQFTSSSGSASPALLVAKLVLGLALTWFAVRTTLFFTALAIGRPDLGLSQSIARTSGQTFRLIGIVGVTLTAVLAIPFLASVAMVVFSEDNMSDARLYPTMLFGVLSQFASLAIVMAGARVYNAIELSPTQNDRY